MVELMVELMVEPIVNQLLTNGNIEHSRKLVKLRGDSVKYFTWLLMVGLKPSASLSHLRPHLNPILGLIIGLYQLSIELLQ